MCLKIPPTNSGKRTETCFSEIASVRPIQTGAATQGVSAKEDPLAEIIPVKGSVATEMPLPNTEATIAADPIAMLNQQTLTVMVKKMDTIDLPRGGVMKVRVNLRGSTEGQNQKRTLLVRLKV